MRQLWNNATRILKIIAFCLCTAGTLCTGKRSSAMIGGDMQPYTNPLLSNYYSRICINTWPQKLHVHSVCLKLVYEITGISREMMHKNVIPNIIGACWIFQRWGPFFVVWANCMGEATHLLTPERP